MKTKRIFALILALAMCFALCAGCGNPGETGQTQPPASQGGNDQPEDGKTTVKIGVLLPFSGSSSYYADHQFYGIKYALDHFLKNSDYDTSKLNIELVTADSTGTADVAVTEFERLVNDEKVNAVIGPYNSGAGAAIAPLAIKYKVPVMIVNAVSDIIMQEENTYVYRTNLGDLDGNNSYTEFLKFMMGLEGGGISKVAYVYENSDYGTSMYTNQSTNVFPALGIDVVLAEPFTSGSGDLSGVVNKVKNSGADMVMVCAFTDDAVLFTRQMAEYQVDVPIFGCGAGFSTEEYAQQCGDMAEYVLNTGSWLYSPETMSAEANEICDAYMAEADTTVPNETFANGWMGMYALLDAIYRANSADRDAIAQALEDTDLPAGHPALMFHSTFGGIRYEDSDGRYNQNSFAGMMLAQFRSGKWEILSMDEDSTLVWPVPSWSQR